VKIDKNSIAYQIKIRQSGKTETFAKFLEDFISEWLKINNL